MATDTPARKAIAATHPDLAPERSTRPTTVERSDGVLVLGATPIGDGRDASSRLAAELGAADVIAVEDTRRLPRLCAALQVRTLGRVLSLHDHNEAARVPTVLAALRAGQRVLVLTDAGMPTVSDPGFRLVSAAIAARIRVTCLPGPSAVLAALAVSGLPVDRFCFEGFLPRRATERRRALTELAAERRTMVFFEAPHRLAETLAAMAECFGADRPGAVCRELTKPHEEIRRGELGSLADWATAAVRGELTLVVAGAKPPKPNVSAALVLVRDEVASGTRLKDACRLVAAQTGVSSRSLYDAVVNRQDASDAPGS